MTRLTPYQQVHKHAGSLEDEDSNNHLLFIVPLIKTKSRYIVLQ